MGYQLGIDLGTTYTAAAVARDARVEMVTLGNRAPSVPTVIYLRQDDSVLTGDAANRRALSEPRPVLWVADQDAWAKGLDYARLPLDLSRRVYEAVRAAVIYYAGEHYERSGHLEFVHSVTGLRTLKDEFDKVASHNAHHLDQIRAALGE